MLKNETWRQGVRNRKKGWVPKRERASEAEGWNQLKICDVFSIPGRDIRNYCLCFSRRLLVFISFFELIPWSPFHFREAEEDRRPSKLLPTSFQLTPPNPYTLHPKPFSFLALIPLRIQPFSISSCTSFSPSMVLGSKVAPLLDSMLILLDRRLRS